MISKGLEDKGDEYEEIHKTELTEGYGRTSKGKSFKLRKGISHALNMTDAKYQHLDSMAMNAKNRNADVQDHFDPETHMIKKRYVIERQLHF